MKYHPDFWLEQLPDLRSELIVLLKQIPRRRVTTFGDLASSLGHSQAAVWIAKELSTSCYPNAHRVIRSTGDVPHCGDEDFAHTVTELLCDGIDVTDGKIDLGRYRFNEFRSMQPLARLKQIQDELSGHVDLRPLPDTPRRVAGLDVSYPAPLTAVAACVICDYQTAEIVKTFVVSVPVWFPYITGLLSFREIPAYLRLLEQVKLAGADVWLIDGSGILHHRSTGIATHLGILLDIPTIGVSKSLLCGKVDLSQLDHASEAPIVYNDDIRGMAIRSTPQSKPLYVSPGHCVDIEQSAAIVRNLFRGHRLPEPIYWADRLSRDKNA